MAEQNVRTIHGPGRRGGMGPRPKVANPGKLLKRVLGEVLRHYTPHCIVVLICIFLSAFANVQASLFLQTLIDDYIAPMLQQQDPGLRPPDRRPGTDRLHLSGGHPGRPGATPASWSM